MVASIDNISTQQGLNPMQLHLINMLNFNNTESAQKRLQQALYNFYLSEFERTKNEMYDSGDITEEKIIDSANKHFRTAY